MEKKELGRVYVISQSMPTIGFVARTTTLGEEFDMVNRFLDHVINHYNKLKKKKAVIFLEPQIETGYPDIVIAEFYSPPSNKNDIRDKLDTNDLKILFHIQQNKRVIVSKLTTDLGFSTKEASRSVKKLSAAGLISLSKNKTHIRNIPLRNYCTIKRLISIEAKLDKWGDAIRQAEHNTWFSSESYIMLNKEKCNDNIRDKCREKGIGIILVNGKVSTNLKGSPCKCPSSYASLQFNEWVYRILNLKDTDKG